jgi:hypothetical protein
MGESWPLNVKINLFKHLYLYSCLNLQILRQSNPISKVRDGRFAYCCMLNLISKFESKLPPSCIGRWFVGHCPAIHMAWFWLKYCLGWVLFVPGSLDQDNILFLHYVVANRFMWPILFDLTIGALLYIYTWITLFGAHVSCWDNLSTSVFYFIICSWHFDECYQYCLCWQSAINVYLYMEHLFGAQVCC